MPIFVIISIWLSNVKFPQKNIILLDDLSHKVEPHISMFGSCMKDLINFQIIKKTLELKDYFISYFKTIHSAFVEERVIVACKIECQLSTLLLAKYIPLVDHLLSISPTNWHTKHTNCHHTQPTEQQPNINRMKEILKNILYCLLMIFTKIMHITTHYM